MTSWHAPPKIYCWGVSALKYATTAFASPSLIRNGIIGKRNGWPVIQIPVVSSLTISTSLAGGVPPIRGACNGQLESAPDAGTHNTGAPCKARC